MTALDLIMARLFCEPHGVGMVSTHPSMRSLMERICDPGPLGPTHLALMRSGKKLIGMPNGPIVINCLRDLRHLKKEVLERDIDPINLGLNKICAGSSPLMRLNPITLAELEHLQSALGYMNPWCRGIPIMQPEK